MLNFSCEPDLVFSTLVNESLEMALDFIDKEEIDVHWLDSGTFKLLGSREDIVIHEIKKLRAAHNSSELFLPTDLHFRLLDRIIEWFCIIYNDMTETQDILNEDGCTVGKFEVDEIRSTFFWDCDYNIIATSSIPDQTSEILRGLGMSPSAINIQKGKPADLSDFTLTKMQPDPDWAKPDGTYWYCTIKKKSRKAKKHKKDDDYVF
jgi:hypothetical protein